MKYTQAYTDIETWFDLVIPCRQACPANTDIPNYIERIFNGQCKEAYLVNKKHNLFPAILGRVCTHPCETVCRRGLIDEPVAICALKRAAADGTDIADLDIKPATPTGKSVAVIGAGPVGLTVAYDLAIKGHEVEVFEASPVVGGMMYLGIPSYRLPREKLEQEVEVIRKAGVKINLDTPIGHEISFQKLRESFDAIFIAVGAHKGLKLNISGEDEYDGFIDAIDFLRDVNLGQKIKPGNRVVVIGGGNTAIDAARTLVRLPSDGAPLSEEVDIHAADSARSALRLGTKEVIILYRRSREEMPAVSWEIDDAEREGVSIHYLTAPIGVKGMGRKIRGIECIRMKLGKPDSSGRKSVTAVPGSEFTIKCDVVISAISQKPDLSFIPPDIGLKINRWGMIEAENSTRKTNVDGIFAAGDVVTGPRTVIEGVAAAHKTALAIDRFLTKEPRSFGAATSGRVSKVVDCNLYDPEYARRSRQIMPSLKVENRKGEFAEVEQGYHSEQIKAEASRCLGCFDNIHVDANRCILCGGCADVCPESCIEMVSAEMVAGDEQNDSTYLVLNEDRCIRCGSCVRRCPTSAITMRRYEKEQ